MAQIFRGCNGSMQKCPDGLHGFDRLLPQIAAITHFARGTKIVAILVRSTDLDFQEALI